MIDQKAFEALQVGGTVMVGNHLDGYMPVRIDRRTPTRVMVGHRHFTANGQVGNRYFNIRLPAPGELERHSLLVEFVRLTERVPQTWTLRKLSVTTEQLQSAVDHLRGSLAALGIDP